jgi:alkanesulfonate monooxygenase SsuD/methylene tetrahydromethanopterin reductase-like flavin-dependent oxidoreductase (luciferase family)
MQLRIFTEPQQGASYDDLLAVAQATERLGFDAFFRSDHYLRMGDGDGSPGPTDAWTTLAGLARETSRIRLGTGWFEAEHRAYGIPFPPKRFGMLEEQLEIIEGLYGTPVGETYSFSGEHYTLVDSPALPKPVQSPLPIIVGGTGPSRTPALAARFATEFNAPFVALDGLRPLFDRVRQACEAIERDPDDLVYSAALAVAVGRDENEFQRRAAAIGRDPEELRTVGIAGTASEAIDRINELGIDRLYLQVNDLHDLEHLDFIAAEIMPHVQ